MIKLESNFKYGYNITRYFKTIEDCNKYLYVFKDHWCNVPWKDPEEITGFDAKASVEAINDPIEIANGDLGWGFNNCDLNNIEETKEQRDLVSKIAEEVIR